MEENLNSVNAESAAIVEPQNEAVKNEPVQANIAEPAESQQEPQQKPIQSPEDNAKFAEMRRAREAAEAKAMQIERDYNISKQYGADYGVHSEAEIAEKYGAQGITTLEQFKEAVKAQEMIDKGIDLEEVKRIAEELPEVKEAKQLKRDRENMAALHEIAPEITDASQIPTEVIQQYIQGKDLADAYAVWKCKADNAAKAAEAAKMAEAEAKAKANAENAKGSMGSVSTNGNTDTEFISKETFEAKKGDRSWIIKNLSKINSSRAKW